MSDELKIDDSLVKEYYELYKFKGFNVEETRKKFFQTISKKDQLEILTICAILSPNKIPSITLKNNKLISSYGIIAGNKQGLSPSRIVTSFAKEIVQIRKIISAPKRLISSLLPAEFHVLGIARAVPSNLISDYKSFCKDFSELLPGGKFDEQLFELSKN